LKGIEEADEVLRFNIVQGALNDKGNYGTCVLLAVASVVILSLIPVDFCRGSAERAQPPDHSRRGTV
jgi:hypothetical protein